MVMLVKKYTNNQRAGCIGGNGFFKRAGQLLLPLALLSVMMLPFNAFCDSMTTGERGGEVLSTQAPANPPDLAGSWTAPGQGVSLSEKQNHTVNADWLGQNASASLPAIQRSVSGTARQAASSSPLNAPKGTDFEVGVPAVAYLYALPAEMPTRQIGPMSQLNGDSLKPDTRVRSEEVTIVPEPATLALAGIALSGWLSTKLRHRLIRT